MSKIKTKLDPIEDHITPLVGENNDPDYLAWKAAKIEGSIEQAKDRASLMPAGKVWEKLGLEP